MFRKNVMGFLAATGLLSLGVAPQVFAVGSTPAGTPVENTASVTYKVDNIDQEAVVSNTAEFTVDRLVNMTLEENGSSYVSTVPGAVNQVTTYTLTNLSNAEIQFELQADNSGGVVFDDDKDGTNFRIFVDDGTGFDPAGTPVTSVNLLGDTDFSASVSPQKTIYVVIDVPLDNSGTSIVNGDRIEVELTATAKEAGGTTLSLGPDADGVNTVLGDDPLLAAGAGQYDGVVIAYGAYEVGSASLTVDKSSEVISDPINGTTSPFAIPGAVLQYCIVVENLGSATATDLKVVDVLPIEVTYLANEVRTGTGTCDKDAAVSGIGTTSVNSEGRTVFEADLGSATIAKDGSVWVSFRVTLN